MGEYPKKVAKGRNPLSPEHHRFELEKQKWLARHPEATAAQYEKAVLEIAQRCGV